MRVGGLRARLVWERAARGAFAACAVERRALCAAGQRGGGVGAHARRINTACPRVHESDFHTSAVTSWQKIDAARAASILRLYGLRTVRHS